MNRKRKAVLFLSLAGVLLAACLAGGGYYHYWSQLPQQQFACWPPNPADEEERRMFPTEKPLELEIEAIQRSQDGSGILVCTLSNPWEEEEPYQDIWVDYLYQGAFYQVHPNASYFASYGAAMAAPFVAPGESVTKVLHLEPKTLSLPGKYRLMVGYVGVTMFEVEENGDIVW